MFLTLCYQVQYYIDKLILKDIIRQFFKSIWIFYNIPEYLKKLKNN